MPSGDSAAITSPADESERQCAFHRDRQVVDAADALERIPQDAHLQLPLMAQRDVAEVRAARPQLGRRVDVGLTPDVRDAVGRGIQDLECLTAPERALRRVGESHPNALPRDRIGDEDDAAFVPADEDAAVGDPRDVEVDDVAGRACRSVHG